jgi:hypothetical protein
MPLIRHASRIVGLILGLFFITSLAASWGDSTTFDEKAHIPAAYSYVRYGDMRLNPEHPPLLKDLAGLPLLAFQPNFPLQDPKWDGINEQWSLGEKFLYESGNDADTILFWSRLPIILIAVLLGFFIYVWTKELAGTLAGLFALILYASDPNILAHSHYVTTDIGIAAFLFMATYFFVRFLKNPDDKNVLLAGLFLGLAQLAKFSAVLLFPLFGLLLVAFALAQKQPEGNGQGIWKFRIGKLWEYLWKYAAIVSICFIVIWFVYLLNTWSMPVEKIRETARASFGGSNAASVFARNFVITLSGIPVLAPLSEYFMGVFMVFARVAGGNTYYFLGNVTNKASSLYFPIVFLLKETLPFLFLLFFSLIYTLIRTGKKLVGGERSFWETVAHSLRGRIAQYAMASFVLLYVYLSVTGNLNIGFRHLFPILPFLYVLVAKTVFDFLNRHRENLVTRTSLHILAGIGTLWILAIPVLAFPSYLSYFNPIGGGSANGYKYVTDSNYDWGQDLKRLKWWVDEYNGCVDRLNSFPYHPCNGLTADGTFPTDTPIDMIRIDYFGGSKPEYYFGGNFKYWHGDLRPEPGWYAISAGFYQENLYKPKQPGEGSYEWLSRYPMVARAGQSIFIYYVSPESLPEN